MRNRPHFFLRKCLHICGKSSTFAVRFAKQHHAMIYRSINMIFEPSGLPVPTEEEVVFEAREILQRSGWGVPLIERLRRIADPYWREALARCLMEKWRELVRDKDEQTYYYDMDGAIRFCWEEAESDFGRIIRTSTNEQAEAEFAAETQKPETENKPAEKTPETARTRHEGKQVFVTYNIQTHNGPIITDSHVNIHQPS